MEKTIEEIEASVIAELVAIRDAVGYRGLRTFDWIAVEVVEFSTFAVGVYTANYAVSLTDKIDPILLRLLYSGLGLDKMDAVEAARLERRKEFMAEVDAKLAEKIVSQTLEINALEAKSAKLVEAIEEIKYEDEVNGKGWENDHNSTYSRLCMALKTYKEGSGK